MTRGGGLSEIQRALWLLSRPITSSYCMKMEERERVEYRVEVATNIQNKRKLDMILVPKVYIFQTLE